MGPNVYFTMSRFQDSLQGNKETVQYFGAVVIGITQNAKQALIFVVDIYRKNTYIVDQEHNYLLMIIFDQ